MSSENVDSQKPTAEKKKITLKSSDGELYDVEEDVAVVSHTIKNMVEDGCADDPFIPIPNVTAEILAIVIEYCKRHAESAAATEADLKAFDGEFVKVDEATLFELILAANYLNIKGLLDLACQTVADVIKDKSVEEVRKLFNITNDFSPEEEEAIRKENAWAFK